MALTLKKFLKYFDDMTELRIIEFPNPDKEYEGNILFKGHVFDEGAKKELKKLYKQGYVLERNEDGVAIMIFPYQNKHGANLALVQINVCKRSKDSGN